MNKFKEYQPLVIQWAKERKLLEEGIPSKQLLKTLEEIHELLTAIEDNNLEEIKDAIGDIMVTLIIYAEMRNVKLEKYKQYNTSTHKELIFYRLISKWNVLYHFEKSEEDEGDTNARESYIDNLITHLNVISNYFDLHIWDCLESAYHTIKNRKGEVKDGTFVKEK